ncbi:MAG: hypothetical protein ABW022_12290 [Actinoplanes sp.]
MNVTVTLLRLHRTIALWVGAILVLVVSIGLVAITQYGPVKFSFWLVIAGAMAKYWPLVVGIIMISMYFRQFVAHGVTRREFLLAVAGCGLTFAAAFAVVVTAGHALESAVLGLADQRDAGYPLAGAGELGRIFPQSLAYFTSGVLITACFYRFRPWVGVALIAPGALPLAAAAVLLPLDEFGNTGDLLPYGPALALTLAAIAAGAAATWAVLRDTPIRRAAR